MNWPPTIQQVGQTGLIHLPIPSLIRKSSRQIIRQCRWLHLFTKKIALRLPAYSHLNLPHLVGLLTTSFGTMWTLVTSAWWLATIIQPSSNRMCTSRHFPTGLTGSTHLHFIQGLRQWKLRLHLPSRIWQIIPPLTVIIQLDPLNICNLNNA